MYFQNILGTLEISFRANVMHRLLLPYRHRKRLLLSRKNTESLSISFVAIYSFV